MAGTLADMKTRIADELDREDLTSQIALAISEAIDRYQKQRFYFNEGTLTFPTVANQATYTSANLSHIPDLYDVDELFVVIASNNYRVKRKDPSFIQMMALPWTKGQPYQYSYYQQQITLFPTPNTIYTMNLLAHYKVAAPASDSEENNVWMVDAEPMIRHAAKRLLLRDVIRDWDAADRAGQAELEAREILLGVSSSMTRTGGIEPMDF